MQNEQETHPQHRYTVLADAKVLYDDQDYDKALIVFLAASMSRLIMYIDLLIDGKQQMVAGPKIA